VEIIGFISRDELRFCMKILGFSEPYENMNCCENVIKLLFTHKFCALVRVQEPHPQPPKSKQGGGYSSDKVNNCHYSQEKIADS
jgi:hypothetical protein